MRFFPTSKVVFMAPTRPLVNQQMEACYDIVGIPKAETAEMTGKIKKEKRVKLWAEKRLFFCTPQTLQSDIEEQTFPAHLIKLVVFDEAHKAKGNYAYCQVIKAIQNVHSNFRVLALTATAGKSKEIIEIIQNLLISKIEYREENSLDVAQYTHKKSIQCVEVKYTPEIKSIINRFMDFIDPNLQKLREAEVIRTFNVSKGYLIMELTNLNANSYISPQDKSKYISILSATIGLYNSLEMLQRFGIHLFLKSFRDSEGKFKFFVALERKLRELVHELTEKYGNIFDSLNTSNQITDYGHPKFELLKTKLQEYFDNDGAKVIIFCEFKDGTFLINSMLQQMKPKVKSQILIGQSGKMTQKEQLAIMKSFREGKINTLVCTCVGEEGLDIGEVDLVICFDIANKVKKLFKYFIDLKLIFIFIQNLTRFVQRIGRTGRKRKGNVIVLASEGREYHNTKELIHTKDTNNKSITRNKDIKNYFYKGPPLFPPTFNPQCIEMKFNINHEDESDGEICRKKKKGKPKKVPSAGNIKNHFKPVDKDANASPMIDQIKVQEISDVEMEIQPIEDNVVSPKKDLIKLFKDEVDTRFKDITNQSKQFHFKFLATNSIKSLESLEEFISRPLQQDLHEIDFNFEINESSQEQQYSRCYDPFSEMHRNSSFMPLNTDFIRDNFPTSPEKNVDSKINFTTPIRKLFKDYDNSPLIDFHPLQKNMIASTPVVAVRQKTPIKIKNTFEFLGITSVDDIFAGCPTFDEIQPPNSDSDQFVDGEGLKYLIMDVSSEEAKKVFKVKNIQPEILDNENQSDIEDEIIGPSQNETPKIPQNNKIKFPRRKTAEIPEMIEDILQEVPEQEDKEEIIGPSRSVTPELPVIISKISSRFSEFIPNVSDDIKISFESQKKLIDIDNLDDIFACDEEMPESKDLEISPKKSEQIIKNDEDSCASDKTIEYDVEEELNKLKSPEVTTSAKTSLDTSIPVSSTSFVTPVAVCKRPNFNKLITAMKDDSFLTQDRQPLQEVSINSQILRACNSSPIKSNNYESPHKSPSQPIVRRRRVKSHRGFLATQANVDDSIASSDENSDEHDDSIIRDFIHDETIASQNQTAVHARYLQSLKSPVGRGNFKMPQARPAVNFSQVFSQMPHEHDSDENDTDLDSFVVDNDDSEEVESEPDELEIAEKKLRERNKKRKRKLKDGGTKKRKIIRPLDSSSDEDNEIKKMRKELLNES